MVVRKVIAFILGAFLLVAFACSTNESNQSMAKQKHQAPIVQKKTTHNKQDMPESIFEGKSAATVEELVRRADMALSAGKFNECVNYFEAAIAQSKPDFGLYQGLFHCKYQLYKLDYTKSLPQDKHDELMPIANKLESLASNELDALNVAIVWMMLREREKCARAVERMGKFMHDHQGLLTEEQKKQVEVETAELAKFIRNPRTSFEDIAKQFSDIIGF